MHQPVQQRGDDDHIAKEGGPILNRAIGGQHRGPFLVATQSTSANSSPACAGIWRGPACLTVRRKGLPPKMVSLLAFSFFNFTHIA